MATLGEKIKHLREENGMTQEDLSKALGISDKSVSAWETNKKYPRQYMLGKFSELFHVSKASLVDDKLDVEACTNDEHSIQLSDECKTAIQAINLLGETLQKNPYLHPITMMSEQEIQLVSRFRKMKGLHFLRCSPPLVLLNNLKNFLKELLIAFHP